jgi:hypothetical protein
LRLSLQYYELLLETYDPRKNKDLRKHLIELASLRPIFDYKKLSIFETYEQEIQNLELKGDILTEIITFQKSKERELLKIYKKYQNLKDQIQIQDGQQFCEGISFKLNYFFY